MPGRGRGGRVQPVCTLREPPASRPVLPTSRPASHSVPVGHVPVRSVEVSPHRVDRQLVIRPLEVPFQPRVLPAPTPSRTGPQTVSPPTAPVRKQ